MANEALGSPGSPPRPLALEASDDLLDKVRQAVEGRPGLNEARDAAADLAPPVDDGLDREDEHPGGGLDR